MPGKHKKVPKFVGNCGRLVLGVSSWWKLTATAVFQVDVCKSAVPCICPLNPTCFLDFFMVTKHFCGRQWYRHVMILWRFLWCCFFVSGLPRGRCFWSKQDVSRNRCEHEFAFNLFWKDFVFWPALTASKHFCGRQWYRHVMILWRFLWCWFLFLASLGGVVFDQNRMCQEIAVNTNSHLISIFQSNYHRCHFRSISECRAGLG